MGLLCIELPFKVGYSSAEPGWFYANSSTGAEELWTADLVVAGALGSSWERDLHRGSSASPAFEFCNSGFEHGQICLRLFKVSAD